MIDSENFEKTVTILGSTGSIGQNTINVIENSPQIYKVNVLTAHSNVTLLAEQAIKVKAKMAVIADESLYGRLKNLLEGCDIEVAAGEESVVEAAKLSSDIVVSAIVGSAGMLPTMEAIKHSSVIALANKECLVCAGSLMSDEIAKYNRTLIPIDSEHSAIFQVFNFDRKQDVEKIILTASGGPFRKFTFEQLKDVTVEQALNHPNWSMGSKITIDSATMMNKGLEVIEAYHLFPINENQIDVIIHPESIVHSMVEYVDGSVLSQLGTADMRTPISLALSWPKRFFIPDNKLDLAKVGQLNFEEVDYKKFKSLQLAKDALSVGKTAPAILNMANEVAVAAFLEGRIKFLDIADIVEKTLEKIEAEEVRDIEGVIEIMDVAHKFALSLV